MAREFQGHLFDSFSSAALPDTLTSLPTSRTESSEISSSGEDINFYQNKMASLEQKIQKMALQMTHMEATFKNQLQDMKQAQVDLRSKLNDRNTTEIKMQELIDRHHNVISVFESRLASLQRINAEQELKIMSYQSTLEEILREIKKRSS